MRIHKHTRSSLFSSLISFCSSISLPFSFIRAPSWDPHIGTWSPRRHQSMNHTHYYEHIRSSSALLLYFSSHLSRLAFYDLFSWSVSSSFSLELRPEFCFVRLGRLGDTATKLRAQALLSVLSLWHTVSSSFYLSSSILSYVLNGTWSPRRHVFLKHKKY